MLGFSRVKDLEEISCKTVVTYGPGSVPLALPPNQPRGTVGVLGFRVPSPCGVVLGFWV